MKIFQEILKALKEVLIITIICITAVWITYVLANKQNWTVVLSALLTPTIAIASIVIGILQWKINQRRLKHELFDRRIEIFDIIVHYIGDILQFGTVERGKENEFLRNT